MRYDSVDGLMPSIAAAPSGPHTRQSAERNAAVLILAVGMLIVLNLVAALMY